MLRMLADENFRGAIVRGLTERRTTIDLVRVQDVGLRQQADEVVLNWAAENNRIVLTHDRSTMPDRAYERMVHGLRMPGMFVIDDRRQVRAAIEELLLIDECSEMIDWSERVVYLPL
jgi:hypothetical protein